GCAESGGRDRRQVETGRFAFDRGRSEIEAAPAAGLGHARIDGHDLVTAPNDLDQRRHGELGRTHEHNAQRHFTNPSRMAISSIPSISHPRLVSRQRKTWMASALGLARVPLRKRRKSGEPQLAASIPATKVGNSNYSAARFAALVNFLSTRSRLSLDR